MCLWGSFSHGPAEALMTSPGPLWACRRTFWEPGDQVAPPTVLCRAALLSSYDGEFRMPLLLAQASPIFHSSCEGKLGIALE